MLSHENKKKARETGVRIVLVTCGGRQDARKIAKAAVGAKLAACVNVVSAPVVSVYRWQGKVETAKEFLLIIKTTTRKLSQLEKQIMHLHRYDVPEFLVVKIAGGSKAYLKWLRESA